MENNLEIIKKETTDLEAQAKGIEITNQTQYVAASNFLKIAIKALQKKIKETFDPIVEAAHRTHREATTARRNHLDPTILAERIVKNKLVRYDDAREAERKAEQDKLERQAKAKEDARKKVLEEQARKKDEEARILREKAEKADAAERAKLEEEARKKEEAAEERREKVEEVSIVAPIAAPKVETPKGLSYKTRYYGLVVDFNKLPNEYKVENAAMINKMCQASKGKIPIPGVEIKTEKVLASRAI